jgi:hypothetical protein
MYKGINEFKKGYQPGNDIAKDVTVDLLADLHSTSNSLKNHFPRLLNAHNVSDSQLFGVWTSFIVRNKS